MPKKFPEEFEWEVVTVARRGDMGVAEVAADFEDGIRGGQTRSEQAEVVVLRRRMRRPEMENEIPRRGAANFASSTPTK